MKKKIIINFMSLIVIIKNFIIKIMTTRESINLFQSNVKKIIMEEIWKIILITLKKIAKVEN